MRLSDQSPNSTEALRERERERERETEFVYRGYAKSSRFRFITTPTRNPPGRAYGLICLSLCSHTGQGQADSTLCFLSLSPPLSASLSFLSVSVCMSVCLPLCLSVCLSVCLSPSLSVSVSPLCLCLSVSLSVSSAYPPTYIHTYTLTPTVCGTIPPGPRVRTCGLRRNPSVPATTGQAQCDKQHKSKEQCVSASASDIAVYSV